MPLSFVTRDRGAVLLWLTCCLFLVASMVFVGGYTRLSGSGLSITEWKPIHGAIPPIGVEEWEEEFAAYRATPQYEKINKGMTMDEFKTIYWPEYFHRLLGRAIGFVFLAPFVAFALRRSITKPFALRLLGIFALGGLQGTVGWLMVASGLVSAPYVSHFKLALHLSIAFLIFALLLWAWLDVGRNRRAATFRNTPSGVLSYYRLWFGLLVVQIVYGAFVAGLHAGLIYNTFPTMNGQWIPDEIMAMSPFYNNFFLNHATVQFIHRVIAVLLLPAFLLWWNYARIHVKTSVFNKLSAAILLVIALQVTLGVLTLIHQVPLPLALAHQMTALLLFALTTALLHDLTRLKMAS